MATDSQLRAVSDFGNVLVLVHNTDTGDVRALLSRGSEYGVVSAKGLPGESDEDFVTRNKERVTWGDEDLVNREITGFAQSDQPGNRFYTKAKVALFGGNESDYLPGNEADGLDKSVRDVAADAKYTMGAYRDTTDSGSDSNRYGVNPPPEETADETTRVDRPVRTRRSASYVPTVPVFPESVVNRPE